MMSLLPSFATKYYTTTETQQTDTTGSLSEWGVDFDTGQLTGQLVDGREAVKVWIWKCLMTTRFYFPIYSWMYGSELESYIGRALPQEYIDTDVKLALQDALLINPEIREIRNFSGYQVHEVLHLNFEAVTRFGIVDITDIVVPGTTSPAQKNVENAIHAIENDMVYFIFDGGRLSFRTYDDLDQTLRFRLDSGHLITDQTTEFANIVNIAMTDEGHVEAN